MSDTVIFAGFEAAPRHVYDALLASGCPAEAALAFVASCPAAEFARKAKPGDDVSPPTGKRKSWRVKPAGGGRTWYSDEDPTPGKGGSSGGPPGTAAGGKKPPTAARGSGDDWEDRPERPLSAEAQAYKNEAARADAAKTGKKTQVAGGADTVAPRAGKEAPPAPPSLHSQVAGLLATGVRTMGKAAGDIHRAGGTAEDAARLDSTLQHLASLPSRLPAGQHASLVWAHLKADHPDLFKGIGARLGPVLGRRDLAHNIKVLASAHVYKARSRADAEKEAGKGRPAASGDELHRQAADVLVEGLKTHALSGYAHASTKDAGRRAKINADLQDTHGAMKKVARSMTPEEAKGTWRHLKERYPHLLAGAKGLRDVSSGEDMAHNIKVLGQHHADLGKSVARGGAS